MASHNTKLLPMLKALRSSVLAVFANSRRSQNEKGTSSSGGRDESACLYNEARIMEDDAAERLATAASVDQSDECCSCLSGTTSILDEVFEVNVSLRSEAISAINYEIATESTLFTKLKQSVSQALAKAVMDDADSSRVGTEMQLKDASCAAEGLVRCIATLRKLHKFKKSLKKSSFTPGQYRKITRMVISKSLAQHHGDTKVDSMLYLLKQFNEAVLTRSSQSTQLKLCRDLVDHFEYFTIEAALSSKKSALRISRKLPNSILPPSEPNANPHDVTTDRSESPCQSSVMAGSTKPSSNDFLSPLQHPLQPPPFATESVASENCDHSEVSQVDSWA
jgi:hypothetical protein